VCSIGRSRNGMDQLDPDLLMLRQAANAGTFAIESLGWAPDAKQMLVFESTARRVVLNGSQQWEDYGIGDEGGPRGRADRLRESRVDVRVLREDRRIPCAAALHSGENQGSDLDGGS
jgi:hypothetical protein